ncbi:AAA family ATPase [Aliarcobacter butzleri]
MISRFKITRLFGFRNVDINFNHNIKVLIGENGFGKTTVLNSLYYLLNNKYKRLSKIEFEEIDIYFASGDNFVFSKFDLDKYLKEIENNRRRKLPLNLIKVLEQYDLSFIEEYDEFNEEVSDLIIQFIRKSKIKRFQPSMQLMSKYIFQYVKKKITFNIFEEFEIFKQKLDFKLIYLPTYRRVEEDLNNLGNFEEKIIDYRNDSRYLLEVEEDREISNDTLIHFGMEDVRKKVIEIETEIEKSTISGFSKLTGEMLSQLLRGFPSIGSEFIYDLDIQTAKIILNRVGDSLSKIDKENINRLLESKESLKEKVELVYFISKLIGIYNEHKYLDDTLKLFKDICNKYLVDKEFRYDESSIDLDIYRINTKERVELNKLSSGEKQIISILTKIYLEKSNNLVILFDEPELSLSLPWQKQLLPDIMNSGKCTFLLAVTHSPFIFDNELENYAVGINMYMDDLSDED